MSTSDNTMIEISNVSMRFNLEQERTDTLKEYIMKMAKGKLLFNEFYALKNISFKINKGESVALIGANGSGKSTLLKIIAGVMYQSQGTVKVNGTIAPLIELGAGFDMNLTARENIFLNGAVLGHDRKFLNQYFDEIIDFAELHDFVDVPVKNFSSGMIARLGFSIATIVDADVLVVDEILSVGDYVFQEKCHKRMNELLAGGTTLLFVSHSEQDVKETCEKSIWLDHGEMKAYGKTDEVFGMYKEMMEHRK